MDARITKQRLANMLSYDWLKIVGIIALAAVFFSLFFTMIGTRPTDGQKFYVYSYNGLSVGGDFTQLQEKMKEDNVFAYEILDSGSESFTANKLYGNAAFTARRAAGEGRVMFINDVRKKDENGNENSQLLNLIDNKGTPQETFGMFLDPQKFLNECKDYLSAFFGEDLSGDVNHEKVRETFMARNRKDARFRSAAKREEGVLLEEARLEKLKADYLLVRSEEGKALSYVTYTSEVREHTIGFSMTQLNITPLVYYTVEKDGEQVQEKTDIALCLFNNGAREGDLKYETVNFLAYLLREYR